MRSARRKTVLWLAGLSLLAVAAVAIFGRQQIVERWYIYRLGSDDSETVDDAARRLAAMGSTRAIMPLIEQLPREAARGRIIIRYFAEVSAWRTPDQYRTNSAVLKALHELGEPAKAAVEREVWEQREEFRVPAGSEKANLRDLLEVWLEGHELHYLKDPRGPADIDADGDIDLLAPNAGGYLENRQGRFVLVRSASAIGGLNIGVGDFDSNGLLDPVSRRAGGVRVGFVSRTPGDFSPP